MSQMSGRFGGKTSTMLFVGQSVTSFWLVIITTASDFGETPSRGLTILYFYISMAFTLLVCLSVFVRFWKNTSL